MVWGSPRSRKRRSPTPCAARRACRQPGSAGHLGDPQRRATRDPRGRGDRHGERGDLKARGLSGVRLVTSDDHAGRKVAIAHIFEGPGGNAADPRDEPHGADGQGLIRLRVVVGRRAVTQARSPEPGHVHRDGPVAAVGVRLPAPLGPHEGRPVAEQPRARPAPLPQRGPGPPRRPRRQAAVAQPLGRPRRAPPTAARSPPSTAGAAAPGSPTPASEATRVHNSVSLRQTASGIRWPLSVRYGVGIRALPMGPT